MPSILFHVQHLVGIGHLMRARLLAEALAAAGLDVHLVSGGLPVALKSSGTYRTYQLPPLRVDGGDFRVLRDGDGRPVNDAYRAARRDRLIAIFDAVAPAALLCETFPFGRRALRFELVPLLDRAAASQPRPRIVASVRDILHRHAAERARGMLDDANRWFDAVLVHSDPRFVAFDTTFPPASELVPAIHHTGFVAEERKEEAPADGESGRSGAPEERREVLVSAGGGAMSAEVLGAALAARERTRLAGAPWRLLAGPNLGEAAFGALCRAAPAGVVVERARSDFAALLRRARVSVSQSGYNTVLDVMRSGARPVLVPYVGARETEQRERALRLRALRLATVVDEPCPAPQVLAAAIDEAVTRDDWGRWDYDDGGAAASAAVVARMIGHPAQPPMAEPRR